MNLQTKINSMHAGKFFMFSVVCWFSLSRLSFSESTYFQEYHQCQTVRNQTRPDSFVGPDLGNFSCFCCCLLTFFKIDISKKFNQSAKHVGSRSGPTKCQSWSGSKLFAKVISRRQKLPLARKDQKKSCLQMKMSLVVTINEKKMLYGLAHLKNTISVNMA